MQADSHQLSDLSPGQRMRLLVMNAGGLSLRFDLFDTSRPDARSAGIVLNFGPEAVLRLAGPNVQIQTTGDFPDHRADTDLANAGEIDMGMSGRLLRIQSRPGGQGGM